ncbi:MAG TPA: 3-dehydroquinate synthase [Planctomycetota bacterium]|nr:3-dehydroquinate synthase [Planctomycetota bacterium]
MPPPCSQATSSRAYVEEISVPFSYPVYFTRGAFGPENPVLAEVLGRPGKGTGRTLAYLDAGLVAAHAHLPKAMVEYAEHHADAMTLLAEPRVLPGGERAKDGWAVAQPVLDEIVRHRLCRHSYVVAAGGGAFLDAVGFAASLAHRGVRLVRLPSTTLSQDDGGVGVKTGVNLGGVKNLVGTFAPPFAVINDLDFLRTLPRDVMLDGIAEAFKVAIIKDAAFFEFLCDAAERLAAGEATAVEETVRRAAVLHLEHIRDGRDPFEMGDARPLDFGHWAAHRLEGLSGYAIRHGQGVAVGIALDSVYAWRKGLLARDELDRILSAFRRCGLPVWHPLLAERDAAGRLLVLDGIEQFREHLGGRLSITLPHGIGQRVEVHEMDASLIEEALGFLRQIQ